MEASISTSHQSQDTHQLGLSNPPHPQRQENRPLVSKPARNWTARPLRQDTVLVDCPGYAVAVHLGRFSIDDLHWSAFIPLRINSSVGRRGAEDKIGLGGEVYGSPARSVWKRCILALITQALCALPICRCLRPSSFNFGRTYIQKPSTVKSRYKWSPSIP